MTLLMLHRRAMQSKRRSAAPSPVSSSLAGYFSLRMASKSEEITGKHLPYLRHCSCSAVAVLFRSSLDPNMTLNKP